MIPSRAQLQDQMILPSHAAQRRLRHTAIHIKLSADTTTPAAAKPAPGRLGDSADLYLRTSYDLLHVFQAKELGKLSEAAAEAAARITAGGTVLSRIGTPHLMWGGCCSRDVPGNPNVAPELTVGFNGAADGTDRDAGVDALKAGDVLFCAQPRPAIVAAQKRGVYLIGIGYPMVTDRFSPPDYNDFPEPPFLDEICDVYLRSCGSGMKDDGVVTPSLTPQVKLLPTSPQIATAWWALTAQLAADLAHAKAGKPLRQADEPPAAAQLYLQTLMARLSSMHHAALGAIHQAGEAMAAKVLAGGKLYPWSGRDEFFIEATNTACGIRGNYPLAQHFSPLDPHTLEKGDILLLATGNATPEAEIETAKTAKAKGAYIVGIYPFVRADKLKTDALRSLCDISIDNLSGDNSGVLDLPGYDHSVIPTQGAMNNYAHWAVIGSYVQSMEAKGVAPHYWMSNHVPGGHEYNDSVKEPFLQRGY